MLCVQIIVYKAFIYVWSTDEIVKNNASDLIPPSIKVVEKKEIADAK